LRIDGCHRDLLIRSCQFSLSLSISLPHTYPQEYVKEYPSHALIELDLYDTNGTSSLLYDLFQADADAYYESLEEEEVQDGFYEPQQQCWGQTNTAEDKKRKIARQRKKKNEKEQEISQTKQQL
jgi:hypothetical protein